MFLGKVNADCALETTLAPHFEVLHFLRLTMCERKVTADNVTAAKK